MSTNRKIALLSLGLSALELISIFHDAQTQVAIAYCLLFLALLGIFIYAAYRTSGPQFTTISIKKTLVIHDHNASSANMTREHKIRVNYGSIPEIWSRGICSDGTIDNFMVDGETVPKCDQIWSPGVVVDLRKRFSEAIFMDHETTVTWTYDLHDSFPERHEALDHDVIPGTRFVEMTVHLPTDRPCINASLHVLVGGESVSQLEDPEISEDRKLLKARVKSPKAGQTLRLSWDW